MRKIIPLLSLLFLSWQASAQSPPAGHSERADSSVQQDLELIQKFIAHLADESVRADVILSQYVRMVDQPTDDTYDFLEARIEEIRLNVQTKNLNELVYIPFAELPKKETRDIDPEGKDTQGMYFIKYKDRLLLALYLEDLTIASITLVSKGNNSAHFVTY